jgi:DNA polymerase III delta prime subunit
MKFVILDEVDYMTKNAQQALRYLLQSYSNNVRFCLICNYISKIDEGLQNEFIRLRFNQLPREDIIGFLKHISDTEKINMSYKSLSNIQKLYRSDIRSMINFIQSNQDIVKNQTENDSNLYIIDNDIWENLICKLTKSENLENICAYVHSISINYNIDKKNIIKDFLNYIIRNKTNIINPKFLNFVENLMHSQNLNNNHHIYYSLSQLSSFVS